jgi:hypothetical protein
MRRPWPALGCFIKEEEEEEEEEEDIYSQTHMFRRRVQSQNVLRKLKGILFEAR